MEKTGYRSTDEALYTFIKLVRDRLLKLAGITTGFPYQVEAVTLKSKKVSPDIIARPISGDGDVVLIEFQGYRDPFIRYRLTAAAASYCAQEEYTDAILPVIFYTERTYQKAAHPLKMVDSSGNYRIHGELKEIVLEDLQEEQLLQIDPQLIALAPFTVPKTMDKEDLAPKAQQWSAQVKKNYPDKEVHKVIDIMVVFLWTRFQELTREEVVAMLNVDLAETKAGKELIEIGKEKGVEEGIRYSIISALETKYELVPDNIVEQINQIESRRMLQHLLRVAIQADNLEGFKKKMAESLTQV